MTVTVDKVQDSLNIKELEELPEEWKVESLDNEYIVFSNGLWKGKKEPFISVRVLRNTNFNNDGTLKLNDIAELDVEEKQFQTRQLIRGDIILERSGGGPTQPVGRVVFFDIVDGMNYSFSNFTSRIRVINKEAIQPKYLLYFLLQFYVSGKTNDIQNRTTGIRNLDFSRYKKISINLPPLPEQQKIAAVLSAVQEAKEKTEGVIKATKELKKSMMKHLFTYGAVSIEEAEKVPLKETEIGMIPEHWEVRKLNDLFEFSKKSRSLQIKENDIIPYIPMELLSEEHENIKGWQLKKMSEISSGTFVFKHDLIIAKITPSFENGKQAILNNLPHEFGYATTEVWALHPKNSLRVTDFIYNYIRISDIRHSLACKMEGATGRQRLPRNVLENLTIPLPPLSEQQQITDALSAIDKKIQAEQTKKNSLDALFKTLLSLLMTGKIRVKDLEV